MLLLRPMREFCNKTTNLIQFKNRLRVCSSNRFSSASFKILNLQIRITILFQFPGSGNTWMRYMIERATGYYTGACSSLTLLYFYVHTPWIYLTKYADLNINVLIQNAY